MNSPRITQPLWLHSKERGARLAYKIGFWIALKLGRLVARFLLYPICAYFMVTSKSTRQASQLYLSRALGRAPRLMEIFRHHHYFAGTVLDRIYLHGDQLKNFDIRMHDSEELMVCALKRQGCLLLGSHLGSFEIVRACGHKFFNQTQTISVRMIMHQENATIASEAFGDLNSKIAHSIIRLGSPDAMLKAKECVENGEFVGILADRLFKKEKAVLCRFFGTTVGFPAGPIVLASILQVPVILFFGLYAGDGSYDVYFERFAERIISDRNDRESNVQLWMQRYVDRLEYYCRLSPYNWFNFYDYWSENF